MSAFSGSVCLLVLLGVVSLFGSPVSYVFENLKQTHDIIAEVLELVEPEIGSRPLFSAVIKSINTSCQSKEQVQLMKTTLDIYAHIFSSILHHQHHPTLLDQLNEPLRSQVESALTKLQRDMENLKKHLSQVQHQDPHHEDLLNDLKKITVDDPLSQRKALAEFKEVYQAASVVASRGCRATR